MTIINQTLKRGDNNIISTSVLRLNVNMLKLNMLDNRTVLPIMFSFSIFRLAEKGLATETLFKRKSLSVCFVLVILI